MRQVRPRNDQECSRCDHVKARNATGETMLRPCHDHVTWPDQVAWSCYLIMLIDHIIWSLVLDNRRCNRVHCDEQSTFMAPPRGLSTPRVLKVKIKNIEKQNPHEIGVYLTDLHQILHAGSCINFQWFPNSPRSPRPLKQPETSIYFFTIF